MRFNAALPFAIDPGKITVEPGLSYTRGAIKAHDYTVGVLSALGSVADRLGVIRGLPAQTMKLNRRRSGFILKLSSIDLPERVLSGRA